MVVDASSGRHKARRASRAGGFGRTKGSNYRGFGMVLWFGPPGYRVMFVFWVIFVNVLLHCLMVGFSRVVGIFWGDVQFVARGPGGTAVSYRSSELGRP